jgi:hypothetical protein
MINRNLLLTLLEAENSKVKEPDDSLPGEAHFLTDGTYCYVLTQYKRKGWGGLSGLL